MRALLLVLLLVGAGGCAPSRPADESGAELWLRYRLEPDLRVRESYLRTMPLIVVDTSVPELLAAQQELSLGLGAIVGRPVGVDATARGAALVVGTPAEQPRIAALGLQDELRDVGAEGYIVRRIDDADGGLVVVAANTPVGALYGSFALLRSLQAGAALDRIGETSEPRIARRILNHWDNLDRTVERGYAGRSLWAWDSLPAHRPQRYRDYARANASLGLNGTVLTNVNANATVLTAPYLEKVAALADEFRPYGLRVYLTARFSAPIEIGGLRTADPLDPAVTRWWKAKVDEIYARIPDFGGLLVKANSEGQPGPQDYHRTHADGANMLAAALAPHGGIVLWRAFVYSSETPVDRIRQAYDEFQPLDGRFLPNVVVQVKNGALDFQPREPFHPLFGAMPKTPLALELQITKEYLGQDTHLAFLAPLFSEVLNADTWQRGEGSTVARVVDGSLDAHEISAISGVANIGTDTNWTGSQFNQANWYAYGRLAWDHRLSPSTITDEWITRTLSRDARVRHDVAAMMLASREAVVQYMTPLGLHHIMARNHHYGPGAWVEGGGRADWTSVYYHRADTLAIGFDRTASGSGAVKQYAAPVASRFGSRATVPDDLLLWFHRVDWNDTLSSGRTLWNEMVRRYSAGVDTARTFPARWARVAGRIDARRAAEISAFLDIQAREAKWWRDASLAYFQTFSRQPIPAAYEQPDHPLAYYLALKCPADVTRPRCPGI